MKKLWIAAWLAGACAASQAAPQTFSIDPTHSFARYEIAHMGLSIQSGTFTRVSGTVMVDMAQHTGNVDVSIDTDSLQTFYAARDKHLKSEAFFNVVKFPTMTYKADKLVFDGDRLTQIQGSLTLLGISRPVNLEVTRYNSGMNPMSNKAEYGANATAHIKRSDFGMLAYIPTIADDVDIDLTIEAIRQ
jgi:polyisoprenoid-binding protein YceI